MRLDEYLGQSKEVFIPPVVGNVPVSCLGSLLFLKGLRASLYSANDDIKSIVIPDGVTHIGTEAFRNCASLQTITLPGSIQAFGTNVFLQCPQLKEINASDNVLCIAQQNGAFSQRLSGITVVVTGELRSFADQDLFKKMLEDYGGRMTGSVSGKTTCVITNFPKSGTTKLEKAKELGIPILSEKEFFEQYFPEGIPSEADYK